MPCFCGNKCVTTGIKVAKLNSNFTCAGLAITACALSAVYQSSIWYRSLQAVQMVPLPEGWGWCDMDGTWKPVWMTLPEAASLSNSLNGQTRMCWQMQMHQS